MRLCEDDQTDIKIERAQKSVGGEKLLMSGIREQFKEHREHSCSIRGTNTEVAKLKDTPKQTSNQPRVTSFNPFIGE